MNRAGILSIVLAAAITGACGSSDGTSATPTAPSPTTPAPSQPAPQPQASCVPQNLSVASIQGTVVTLQWNAVSGATEYTILVGSTPGSADQLSTNTTQSNYTWTAKKGLQYARVQSKCSGVYGASSNEINYTVY